MRHFYFHSTQRLIVIFVLLVLAVTTYTGKDYFYSPEPYVRLATLWDAPGLVFGISSDYRLLIIYDETADKSRLVEVSTGNILMERAGRYAIVFSPTKRFITAYNSETQTTQIIEAADRRLIVELPAGSITFSLDESLAMILRQNETPGTYTTEIIDTSRGSSRGEFDGYGESLSPDNKLVAIVDHAREEVRVSPYAAKRMGWN